MLHPVISTIKTRTGRTSSEEPNSQNFPKHGDGIEVRTQIADRKRKFVAFDFAGIQARNIAMESKDKTLVDAFWNNYDIHTDWLNHIVDIYPSWIPGGKK